MKKLENKDNSYLGQRLKKYLNWENIQLFQNKTEYVTEIAKY